MKTLVDLEGKVIEKKHQRLLLLMPLRVGVLGIGGMIFVLMVLTFLKNYLQQTLASRLPQDQAEATAFLIVVSIYIIGSFIWKSFKILKKKVTGPGPAKVNYSLDRESVFSQKVLRRAALGAVLMSIWMIATIVIFVIVDFATAIALYSVVSYQTGSGLFGLIAFFGGGYVMFRYLMPVKFTFR